MSSFPSRFELAFWSALPMLITLCFVVLYILPKHIGGLGNVMPPLHLVVMFYWGMLHIKSIPYWFVFLVGLLLDALTGLPLGASSLVYLLFMLLMRIQRKYVHKEGFLIKWALFSALLLVMAGLQWLLVTSLGTTAHALFPLFIQWLITVCFYPAMSRVFDVMHGYVSSRKLVLLHTK
jgi:rod shape-determining protein MreD